MINEEAAPAVIAAVELDKEESIFDLFATNEEAEKKGKWLTYGKVRFLVARAGGANKAYVNALAKVMRPHARRLKLNQISPDEAGRIALPVFVKFCLLNWENVRLKNGTVLPFSQENAEMLLTQIPELYTSLLEDANNIATFAPEDVEDVTGN